MIDGSGHGFRVPPVVQSGSDGAKAKEKAAGNSSKHHVKKPQTGQGSRLGRIGPAFGNILEQGGLREAQGIAFAHEHLV